jgi:putative SOS response-associated peptidase YedK
LGPARDTARRTFVVDRKDYDAWLVGTVDEARAVLKQYPADKIEAWPVSTRVNTPKNNDAGLVVRV